MWEESLLKITDPDVFQQHSEPPSLFFQFHLHVHASMHKLHVISIFRSITLHPLDFVTMHQYCLAKYKSKAFQSIHSRPCDTNNMLRWYRCNLEWLVSCDLVRIFYSDVCQNEWIWSIDFDWNTLFFMCIIRWNQSSSNGVYILNLSTQFSWLSVVVL